MPDFHRLDAASDDAFLRRKAVDPLSRVAFRPTNAVALCATCGLVSLRETWDAVGGCPNGHAATATWDAAVAARSAGDGARTRVPRPAPVPPPPPPVVEEDEAPRRTGLWIALGAGALLIAALGIFALLNRGDADNDDPAEAPVVAGPTAPQSVVTEIGETEGVLASGDFQTPEGFYQDLYAFAADSSNQAITFTLSSEAFYPDLVVTGPDGTVTEAETVSLDEDSDVRRVIVRDLRGPGIFQVLVSSRRRTAEGAYTLRIRQEEPVVGITAGRQVPGKLDAKSPRANGRYRSTYGFVGATDREHTITVRSGTFAPVVTVVGPAGPIRGQSAPTSGGTIFRFTPTRAGTYEATVSTAEAAKTGEFTILLAVAPPPPPPPTRPSRDTDTASPASQSLRPGGAAVRDSLDAGGSRTYTATGRIGDRITAEIRAQGFTPTLTIIGPDGQRTPASPDGDRARARVTLPTDGRYRIVIGSTGGGGAYSVSLEAQAAVTAAPIPRLPGAEPPRAADPDYKPPVPPTAPAPGPPAAPAPGSPNYRPQPLGGNN